MPWETIHAGRNARSDTPALSLGRNGLVSWNLGLHEALGKPEFVRLVHDADRNLLGLQSSEDIEGAFRVRRAGKQRTWVISALGPLRLIGAYLEVGKAYRRRAKEYDGGVWGIEVGELRLEQGKLPAM